LPDPLSQVRLSEAVDGKKAGTGAGSGSPAKPIQTDIGSFFARKSAAANGGAAGGQAAGSQASAARVLAAGVFAQLPLSAHVEALLAQVRSSRV
jgi:hypothetical protein